MKTLFALLIFSYGCTSKYYYVENGTKEEIINATSDSAAYIKAFERFEISKSVYAQMKADYGAKYLTKPTRFDLLNADRKSILSDISFSGKENIEKDISTRIKNTDTSSSSLKTSPLKSNTGLKQNLYDTTGLYLAPVKVLAARFVTREYSNLKDVALTYKNASNKSVAAIRFRWYGENAFNEPAEMTGVIEGWGAGFSETPLKSGSKETSKWDILSKDGKKIIIAYAYEVAFSDGSKWSLNE